MAHDPDPAVAHQFILQTYSYYVSLMHGVQAESGTGASEGGSRGGQLLWAGELDEVGRALTVAGNVAGTATLAVASDADAQRQAVRDGVVDFLVNSLDESLRILKNEVRKRETVAVCVGAPLESVEREMVERGVQPDVFREGVVGAAQSTGPYEKTDGPESDSMSAKALVVWKVDRAPALWLPKLDAIALDCLDAEETIARRWLMRSSRYLGRIGQAEHLVWGHREFAAQFMERMQTLVERGEIAVGGRIEVASRIGADLWTFHPPDATGNLPQA